MKIEDLKKKYKYIVAWGKLLGSHWYYVKEQLYKAENDNAPKDVIYYNEDYGWVKPNDNIKEELQFYIDGKKGGIEY